MGVRRGDQHGQREPFAVAQDVDLAAGFAAVDRVCACGVPLFVARTAMESTIALDQSISLITFSRCRNC
jgi:hypothetical protein